MTRGFLGRLFIAVEPAALAALFAFFAVLLLRKPEHADYRWIAAIVAVGAITFIIYAIVLMIAPARALLETWKPIFIVDGYLRTRGRDDFSTEGSNGYVAVLDPTHRVVCEWSTVGQGDLPFDEHPAYLEFSEYGGVHSIDGRPTGVLPEKFPPLGIGGNRPPRLPKM